MPDMESIHIPTYGFEGTWIRKFRGWVGICQRVKERSFSVSARGWLVRVKAALRMIDSVNGRSVKPPVTVASRSDGVYPRRLPKMRTEMPTGGW